MRNCLSMILRLSVFLTLLFMVNAGSTADLNDGLVAYWPMDEGSGDITRDATGHGNDGVLLGDAKWEAAGAKIGKACIIFDGKDDLVEIEPFDVEGGGITLAAWINPISFNIGDGRIITKAVEWGADDHLWMLSTTDANHILRFRLKTDDGQSVPTMKASAGGLVTGEWQHVAATWDGSNMKLYQGGVEVGVMAKGGNAVAVDDSAMVAIGSQPHEAFATDATHVNKFFDGLIDDVVVYNRALADDELKQLASGLSPNLAVEPAGKLTATWGMLKQ